MHLAISITISPINSAPPHSSSARASLWAGLFLCCSSGFCAGLRAVARHVGDPDSPHGILRGLKVLLYCLMSTLLKTGQLISGSLFSEPMRVETIHSNGNSAWILGLVGIQSQLFRRETLNADDLSQLEVLNTRLFRRSRITPPSIQSAAASASTTHRFALNRSHRKCGVLSRPNPVHYPIAAAKNVPTICSEVFNTSQLRFCTEAAR